MIWYILQEYDSGKFLFIVWELTIKKLWHFLAHKEQKKLHYRFRLCLTSKHAEFSNFRKLFGHQ